jgi:hypothetical protein
MDNQRSFISTPGTKRPPSARLLLDKGAKVQYLTEIRRYVRPLNAGRLADMMLLLDNKAEGLSMPETSMTIRRCIWRLIVARAMCSGFRSMGQGFGGMV